MNVALVIEQLDLQKGGQERSTLEIAERLAARGISTTLIAGLTDNLPGTSESRIIDLKLPYPPGFTRYLEFVKRAGKVIRSEKIDLVHAITPIPIADVYQPRGGLIQETFERNLARRKGFSQWIRRLIGPNFRQRMLRRTERELASKTNCQFLAVSDYVRRQCQQHLHLDDQRVHVIFNGVDISRLPEKSDPQRRSHLRSMLKIRDDQLAGVFAATNFGLKGLGTILEAAVLLRNQHPQLLGRFKFLICGPDNPRPHFERIRDLGLEQTFLLLGPTGSIGQLYEISDFLIHPTWYDPCSRVVLEALACGVPAISTRFNGASELIQQVDGGFVLDDPGDAQMLMEFWVRLLDDNLRSRFARNARTLRSQISMEHHVGQLIQFYEKILAQKG